MEQKRLREEELRKEYERPATVTAWRCPFEGESGHSCTYQCYSMINRFTVNCTFHVAWAELQVPVAHKTVRILYVTC